MARPCAAAASLGVLVLALVDPARAGSGPAERYLEWSDAVSAPAPPPAAGKRLILIGWDGADWELLDQLMTGGAMPNLTRLVREGRTAVLESYPPTVSPMVWTTIATGAAPPDHGVLDFFEIEPGTGRYVPISALSRLVPAFWSVASEAGRSVGVVNFWATHPAQEVRGFLVSDRACPPLVDPDPSELASAVYPPAYVEGIRSLLASNLQPGPEVLAHFGRFHPGELKGQSAQLLAKLIRNTRVAEEAAERLYDKERPQSLTLYFLGTDEVDHLFGDEVAPRLPCVSEDRFARFGSVVPRYYAWVDSLLGRWMRRAKQDGAELLIVSDHGFKWGSRRSCGGNPLERRSAVFAHRPEGMAAAWGKDVRPARQRGKASVFDIVPTLSALLEIPVDRREPGQAHLEWFSGVRAAAAGDVWTKAPAPKFLPKQASVRTNEYAERLAALGYLSGPLPSAAAAPPAGSRPGKTETAFLNLGVWRNSREEREEAVQAFKEALRVRPGDPRATVDLIGDLLRLHRNHEAVEAAMASAGGEGEGQDWAAFEIAARLEEAGLIAEEERFLSAAIAAHSGSEPIEASLAGLRLEQGRCDEALRIVTPLLPAAQQPDTFNVAGLALKCLGRFAEGKKYLERSLALNPSQPAIRQMLAEP
jgi:predicted AlkP superfamily phosphohydrolase/phosphomutase